MAKSGRTRGRYERLKRAALDHFPFCRRPSVERKAVSQLFEARPKSDGSYQEGKCGANDSFHRLDKDQPGLCGILARIQNQSNWALARP
jgi:hypothetical protein